MIIFRRCICLFKKIISSGVIISLLLSSVDPIIAYADTPESTIEENKAKYQELNSKIIELNSEVA